MVKYYFFGHIESLDQLSISMRVVNGDFLFLAPENERTFKKTAQVRNSNTQGCQ
jgi:hypothetical protein